MCGIVLIASNKDISHLESTAKQMNELQHHRGPDGEGYWRSNLNNIHLAHKRLAILDVSSDGAQPMHSKDGRYTIIYNGEIYNFEELRNKCIAKGSKFKSKTDTEVVIEYIAHFGVNGIKDFRGMWAFALYDSYCNKLLISRDPFGIKPLHYGIKDGIVYIASEIKSLRCVDNYFAKQDEITKKLFLEYGYVDLGDWTFFENIKRFPQASSAEINLSDTPLFIQPVNYWQPPITKSNISDKQAVQELRRLLDQSVTRHMRSDVPISFCLSGGLDSSVIVALAAKMSTTQGSSNNQLHTFTTHYPNNNDIDETKWAKLLTSQISAKATLVKPTVEQFKQDFESLIYYHDEPFASASVYAQNAIFKAIHGSGIKVSLDGQGADEIFAGYLSFNLVYLLSLMRRKNIFRFIYETLCLLVYNPRVFKVLFKKNITEKLKSLFVRSTIRHKISVDNPKELQRRLKVINSNSSADFTDRLLYSLTFISVPCLLRNGDRASMKYSVESRVPFLDIDLVNFVLSLPDTFKVRHAINKYILRKIAQDFLPTKLAYRKDKLGFPAPEKEWLEEAFNIKVDGPFTKRFRELVISKWEQMLLVTENKFNKQYKKEYSDV